MGLLKATNIGTTMDRLKVGNYKKWTTLDKINKRETDKNRSQENHKIVFQVPVLFEIKRLKSLLDIQCNGMLTEQIYQSSETYYRQLKLGSRYRNSDILAPVALYLTCLERFIVINIKELYRNLACKRKQFQGALQEILKKNKMLYYKIHTDEWRKKYIYQCLVGLKNHFKLLDEFLTLAGRYLSEYYEEFKNKKDTVIVALIFAKCKKFLGDRLEFEKDMINYRQVCDFLGIVPSIISNNKDLWKGGNAE